MGIKIYLSFIFFSICCTIFYVENLEYTMEGEVKEIYCYNGNATNRSVTDITFKEGRKIRLYGNIPHPINVGKYNKIYYTRSYYVNKIEELK